MFDNSRKSKTESNYALSQTNELPKMNNAWGKGVEECWKIVDYECDEALGSRETVSATKGERIKWK